VGPKEKEGAGLENHRIGGAMFGVQWFERYPVVEYLSLNALYGI
jgi:hypothetical protein